MRLPPRPTAAALALSLALVFAGASARAQDRQYQVQLAANLQATDNVLFTPMNGPASAVCRDGNPANDGQNCPIFGFIGELNPSIALTYETPRWLHALTYNFALAWVLGGQDQVNYEHRLEARSRYDLSDLTQTNHALRVGFGQQTFFPQAQPGQALGAGRAAAFQPPAQEFHYVNLELQQGVTRALGVDTAFTGQLGFQNFRPIQDLSIDRERQQDPPRPGLYTANVQLAVQHNDAPTEYAVTVASQLTAFDLYCRVAAECGDEEAFACVANRCVIKEGQLAPARRDELEAIASSPQLISRAVGTVRRDWENGFRTDLDLGVQHVMRVTDLGGQNVQPVARVALGYDREEAQIELTYNHGAQINPAVVGVVMADNFDLVANIPIDRETRNFALQLQAGYQKGSLIDELGDLRPTFDLFAGDVALEYRPRKYIPTGAVGFRYQFRYQITELQPGAGDAAALQEGPLHAMRNAWLLTLGYQFPDRGAAP